MICPLLAGGGLAVEHNVPGHIEGDASHTQHDTRDAKLCCKPNSHTHRVAQSRPVFGGSAKTSGNRLDEPSDAQPENLTLRDGVLVLTEQPNQKDDEE